jgi:hypothetical protein
LAIVNFITAMPKKEFHSGDKVKESGQYETIGPRGGRTGHEVTGVKGKVLPPTPKPGQSYQLVDRTKHKR